MTGRDLYVRRIAASLGCTVERAALTDGARYFDSMNPAEKQGWDELARQLVEEFAALRAAPFLVRAADALYAACEEAVRAGRVDARSRIGDATLDYRELREEARGRAGA